MRRNIVILATTSLAVSLIAVLVGLTPARAADDQWSASYWNNTALKGKTAWTQTESAVNYNWGTKSPVPGKVNADTFSARWTRSVNFTAGSYVFTSGSDDGIRVWVDKSKIIDQWDVHYYQTASVTVTLTGGEHAIKVEYFEDVGSAAVSLTWVPVSGNAWTAQYFNGTNLSGKVIVTRQENTIKYNWGKGSPAPKVNGSNFSVRWTRTDSMDAGKYQFKVVASGGFRVYVDGANIMDEWWNHGGEVVIDKYKLKTGGNHTIRVEFYNRSGSAQITVKIKKL